MAEPLITESEVRRTPDCLKSRKGADPDMHFPKALKPLKAPHCPYTCYQLTAQLPEDWRRAIVTPVAKAPCTIDLHVCCLQNP